MAPDFTEEAFKKQAKIYCRYWDFKHAFYMFVISIILFTLGGLNAYLATTDTCAQGSAETLGGVVFTLILYVFGAVALVGSEPKRPYFLALLPAAFIACWQTIFTVRFFIGYWFNNIAACSAMWGDFSLENAGKGMDGDEAYYTLLWLAASLMFWIGMVCGFRSSRPMDDN